MKIQKIIAASLAAMTMTAGMALQAAAEGHEDLVTLAQTPAPVQQMIQQYATAMEIKKIDMEIEDAQTVYSVEIVKDGKETELEVAADGTLMEADEEITLDAAPEAVKKALATQAGRVTEISKLTEKDVVQYEATLEQNGEEQELLITAQGQIIPQKDDDDEEQGEEENHQGHWGKYKDHENGHEGYQGKHEDHEDDD